MGKINLLDDRAINQIAAGEVVENPASVVKELVENSIDAGSASVTVEIVNGGTESIRIIDNGSGMDEDDVQKAFLRHATSKVASADDLQHISTMGFRGEALASISEVSHVELTTSTGDVGTQIVIRGGKCESVKPIGFPRGTTIEVSNLFFNTPARKKFLKSIRQETSNVLELCSKFILAYPQISFKIFNNGRLEMRSDGKGNMLDAVCAVYGSQTREEICAVSAAVDNIEITGCVCKPAYAQLNRKRQSFFVNGRYVKSALIAAALDEAYKGKLMVNKFPFAVLYIKLPYEDVDVNVHPQKTEVRFSNSRAVFSAIMKAVLETLRPDDSLPELKLYEHKVSKDNIRLVRAPEVEVRITDKFDDGERNEVDKHKSEEPVNTVIKNTTFQAPHSENNSLEHKAGTVIDFNKEKTVKSELSTERGGNTETKKDARDIGEIFAPKKFVLRENRIQFDMSAADEAKQDSVIKDFSAGTNTKINGVNDIETPIKVCGTLWDTYIFVQSEDLCCIIDQHAAHERFLYDKYYEDFIAKKVAVQQLLIPEAVEAEPAIIDIISENAEIFNQLGFDVEVFGTNSCIVRGVPSVTCNAPFRTVFNEAIELMKRNLSAENVVRDIVCPELMKSACKHAVKGNQKLSDAEIKFIVESLKSLHALTCPHGRPIAITISRKEMEKRFGRIQ